MKIKIKLVKFDDLIKLAEIYSKAFSEADPQKPWDIENSYKHLKFWFDIQPDMFFVAFDKKDNILGGVASLIKPWRISNRCSAGVIFVNPDIQTKGVGRVLFSKMLSEAIKKYNAKSFEAITFAGKEFPASWYKSLGILPDKGALLVKGSCFEILSKL